MRKTINIPARTLIAAANALDHKRPRYRIKAVEAVEGVEAVAAVEFVAAVDADPDNGIEAVEEVQHVAAVEAVEGVEGVERETDTEVISRLIEESLRQIFKTLVIAGPGVEQAKKELEDDRAAEVESDLTFED